MQGDLTEAYGKKVRQVTRSFVFLNLRNSQVPAALVVFDRVVSVNPEFRKYWLLHTLEEPHVDTASAVVDCIQYGNSGRLTLDTLLPACSTPDPGGGSSRVEGVPPSDRGQDARDSGMGLGSPTQTSALGGPFQPMNHRQDADATTPRGQDARDTSGWATLTKVGGPGKEFWVFGQNYANDVDPKRLERSSIETGAWRIEVSPKAGAAEDLFLNVMQVTDRQSSSRWPVRSLEADDRVGCLIAGPESSWAILLRRDSQRSPAPVKFTVPGDRPSHVLVTDLSPGPWHVRREGSDEVRNFTVGEDSGTAWFEGPAATWTLSR